MWKHLGRYTLTVLATYGLAHADARDDARRARSDFDSLRSRHDDSGSRLDRYLAGSIRLRSFDKDQLEQLVTGLCKLDIEQDSDPPDQIAKGLRDSAIERVRREYDTTVEAGSKVFDELGRVESDAKSLHGRARDLESQDDVKDDARRLREDIEKLMDANVHFFEKIKSDRSTLDRVKEGTMNGANNPLIRARMEYGKEMHRRLQSDRGCHEKEVSLSSGRPDCIRFDPGDCKVVEFKPDTWSSSDAQGQAENYVRDVRDRFKNDERAKQCKQDSDGPVFRGVGETYTACRP